MMASNTSHPKQLEVFATARRGLQSHKTDCTCASLFGCKNNTMTSRFTMATIFGWLYVSTCSSCCSIVTLSVLAPVISPSRWPEEQVKKSSKQLEHIKTAVLWYVIPRGDADGYQHFGGAYVNLKSLQMKP